MLDGFKKFILRGNVVDMAVGIVIGAAFGDCSGGVYQRLADAIDSAAVGKGEQFAKLSFTIHGTAFSTR